MALDPYFNKTVLAAHFDEIADADGAYLGAVATGKNIFPEHGSAWVPGTVVDSVVDGIEAVKLTSTTSFYGVYHADAYAFTDGDFTFEFWFYPTAYPADGTAVTLFEAITGAAYTTGALSVVITAAGGLHALFRYTGTTVAASFPRPALNTWHHIAVTVRDTTCRFFLDGVFIGYVPRGDALRPAANGMCVGRTSRATYGFAGYVAGVRIYKGIAKYLDGFLPDFAAAQRSPGVLADDSRANRRLVGGGSAVAPYVADSKFGGGCLRLDGASYLECAASADWNLDTGDFTIEAWVKPLGAQPIDGDGVNAGAVVFCTGGASGQNVFGLLMYSTDMLFYANDTTVLRLPVPDGWTQEWHHLAVTRQAGTVSLWFDGALLGSVAYATAIDGSTRKVYVGGRYYSDASYFWNSLALLDDVRITKGAARYTGDFTPPTETFPNGQAGVSGVIRDADGVLCSRRLFAHSRATGRLLGTAVSNPTTGTYEIAAEEECYVVCLDSTDSLNAKIVDGVDPTV